MKLIEAEKAKDVIHEYFKLLMVNGASGTDVDRLAVGIGSCLKHDANLLKAIDELPSAEPDTTTHDSIPAETGKNDDDRISGDCISRQAAIDALHMHLMYRMGTDSNKKRLDDWINGVPSAQPKRTCVNCGRTANNGGWYADGGTRCPIEEHYALPKDGYCHLWEKRNVTDDDYPERREE